MSKVLFIFNSTDYSFALFPFLLKYKVDTKTMFVNAPYYHGDMDTSAIDGRFKFKYNDTDIDLFYTKEGISNDYNAALSYIKPLTTQYDKIYLFKEWNSFDINFKSFENVEIMYYKADENFHKPDAEINRFLSEFRIISSASISFTNKNFYFEPILNLFVFYYDNGFDYSSYSLIDNKKTNLLGMYYIKYYKEVRDRFYNKFIKPIFEKHNIDGPVIYDTNCDKPQLITQLLQNHKNHWKLNVTTKYSDYINSVCGFVFDTLNHTSIEGPNGSVERYYVTEKVLKAIMYSKLNILFILDTNPNNFEILHNLGFWFLNSEFYEFNTNNSTEDRVISMQDGIVNSMEYLIEIYKQNNFDLNKTHQELVEKYGDKMQNNYDIFIKYLTDAPDSNKLLNFILYGEGN